MPTPSALLLVVCAALPSAIRADPATETRLREALRTSTTQLRAAEEERARWQAKEAALQKELESLRRQLAVAKPVPVKVSDRAMAELSHKLAAQTEENARLSASLAQCQTSAREAADSARAKEEERTRLAAQLPLLTERATSCEAKNARLFQVSRDALYRIAETGAAPLAREPFLGLERVELENLAQDYQDQLLEQKVKP